jgi:hypothetical protein
MVVYPHNEATKNPTIERKGHVQMRNAYHRIIYPDGYIYDWGEVFFCVMWSFAGSLTAKKRNLDSPNHFVPVVQ